MKPNDYLEKVLSQQTFNNDDPELKELRKRRDDIKKTLTAYFDESKPSIRWAGSMAKGTMIRDAYDGDMTCYFPHDESKAGETLAEIYDNTEKALQEEYDTQQKASAIRVKDRSTIPTKGRPEDLHIDVVPGRFTGDEETDVFLHRTTGDKQRLKTDLDTHIEHIRDSGVTDAIRLIKLWKDRNNLYNAKTFVLELLVVKLLKNRKSAGLSTQLEHIWTEFRDNSDGLAVEDPANPSGNDLKPILDDCRSALSTTARNTLWQIENNGWEAVFGPVDDDDDEDEMKESLGAAAIRVPNPTKPWLSR